MYEEAKHRKANYEDKAIVVYKEDKQTHLDYRSKPLYATILVHNLELRQLPFSILEAVGIVYIRGIE